LPDSRHKYLYERLGDHDFQQLVNALLTHRFSEFRPLPLRQADGGRDGVSTVSGKSLIYQVKWSTKGTEKDPVSWLNATISQEMESIRELAAAGAKRYIIVTNVPSTGRPGSGTFDRLNEKLQEYSRDLGIDMSALWREALNGMVDTTPDEVKWAYADMLAGWDLVRYLLSGASTSHQGTRLRDLLHKVAAAQWEEDETLKFSQVELDRERVVDLFVDVPATRIKAPDRVQQASLGPSNLGGAARYLRLISPYPFTLVRGAPGQGKSTLGQYVCQAFRVAFMPNSNPSNGLERVEHPRFPIRFDLDDYAAWMQGHDVFDDSDTPKANKRKPRNSSERSIEAFLAELMTHLSGSNPVTALDVQDIFDRVPSVVVLDGLDEVGSTAARQRVVKEINLFCSRGKTYSVAPRVVVTTRPNSGNLPEPDASLFEVISLSSLDPGLRDEYLRKWCAAHNVRGNDARTLRRNFTEKTREPYIGELAGNPMQLTILLFLLRQHGDATPSQRTELYDAYMTMLLAREANKHPASVRKYRAELMEIVPFLGWYTQSRAEEHGHSGKITQAEATAAMKHFQHTYGRPEGVVDELFQAATDRLWALTSKEEGHYEFEVLSLREYFAAQFLYRYAGEGTHRFDSTLVLRELLRRPNWLNTTRFYGGNATGADIYALQAGITHELTDNPSKQVHVASWTLITDGVFNTRPLEAAQIIDLLCQDIGASHLVAALDGREISPLPDRQHATATLQRITSAMLNDPADLKNTTRIRLLNELLGQKREVTSWWMQCVSKALGTGQERAWLRLGAEAELGAGQTLDLPPSFVIQHQDAQYWLNSGIIPAPGSTLENQLNDAVLGGHCTATTSVRSEVAQVAVALNPCTFYTLGLKLARPADPKWSDRRSQAIQQLKKSQSSFSSIIGFRRFQRGESGTTYPWANEATALFDKVGRCWLVTEIAVIGAASPLRLGYTKAHDTQAFGPNSHPATLIAETRAHRSDVVWWNDQLTACHDTLSQAEWAFALWGVGTGSTIDELMPEIERIYSGLPSGLAEVFSRASTQLGSAGFLSKRQVTALAKLEVLQKLLTARSPKYSDDGTNPFDFPHHKVTRPEPLAAIARRDGWLKVDKIASYR
jgi:hypothetical protein